MTNEPNSPDVVPPAASPAGQLPAGQSPGELSWAGAVVYVVDDDAAVRRLVAAVLGSEGVRVEQCASGEQFLATATTDVRGCILLDVDMPGMTGPELQALLATRNLHQPVVFLTGMADVDTSVAVMKRGAVDLIQKPFKKDRLLDVVRAALSLDAKRAAVRRRQGIAKTRYDTLNPREREVMGLVVDGLANKQVARRLDLSEKTIEVHRARVMAKMGADSLAELVRLALDVGVGPEAGNTPGVAEK
jgi:two-component system response regulator FixJ